MRNLIGFILISFLSLLVQGQDLRAYSQSLPKILIDHNIDQVGDIKVSELIKDLDQVKWEVTEKSIAEGSGKPRFACNYFIKDKKVICNATASSPAVLPLVTLHEGLGALGYKDEDYEISSAIAIHALTRRKATIKGVSDGLFKQNKRTKDEVYKSLSGGTSVGGGGDSVGINIKTFAVATLVSILELKNLTKNQESQVSAAIERIMVASFENNINPTEKNVQINFQLGKEEVLIPFTLWNWIQMNTTSPNMVLSLVDLFDPILTHFLKPL